MAEGPTTGGNTGRQTRDADIQQERRRRKPGTLDRSTHLKLAVPDDIRDKNPGQHFRWINDSGNRLHFLTTQDDYSKVDGVEPVPVGTSEDGKPVYAHLCKKPLDYFNADQAEKSERSREIEKGLLRAATPPGADGDASQRYVPSGNSIRRG